MASDPYWPRASAWLASQTDQGGLVRLAVLGAPVHRGSITPGQCHLAPQAIRAALQRFSLYDVGSKVDLSSLSIRDWGDLDLEGALPEQALAPIEGGVRRALSTAEVLVLLGGDNSITRGGCRGLADSLKRCGLLTLDAHLDFRDLKAGLSNGNPVSALVADGLSGSHVVQVGIQPFANSKVYAERAHAAGIRIIPADEVRQRGIDSVVSEVLRDLSDEVDAIYVDLDLDVLDRIHAPATPGSRPGGLMPAEILLAARRCGLNPKVKILDLVELDPTKDIADVTVMTAAACLLAFASGVVGRTRGAAPGDGS